MTSTFGAKVLPEDSPAIRLLEENDATGRGLYISHIDRSPVRIKMCVPLSASILSCRELTLTFTHRIVFMVPLFMYIAVSAFMIWRASKNYHVVLALVLNDFYYVETASSKRIQNGFWSWCWMFMVASIDYYLLSILWPLVRGFLTGHLWLRLRYGFRETEVVFRTPTGGEYVSMMALPPNQFQQAWQTSLLQATNRQFLTENAGFNTRSPPWHLCYTASTDAYRLANSCQFDLKNWELSVWEKDRHQQWTVMEVWKHQDSTLCVKALSLIKVFSSSLVVTGRLLTSSQEKLIAEGREGLVEKWQAVLNGQAGIVAAPLLSQPTPAIEGLVETINTLFLEEGLDIDGLWTEAMSEADRIHNQPAPEEQQLS